MSYAVKAVTTERGVDAGSFLMVVYGGAGPLHASAIAREIGIKQVLIPFAPGYFCPRLWHAIQRSPLRLCAILLPQTSRGVVRRNRRDLIFRWKRKGGLQSPRRPSSQRRSFWKRAADMRYVGQEHAVTVELPSQFFADKDRDAIKRRFDEIHAIGYGTSAPKEPADLVSLRTTILGTMRKPPRHTVDKGETEPPKRALRTTKEVFFRSQGFVPTPIFKREALRSGNRVIGPALIEEHASTTVVQPGDELTVDGLGNLQILIGSERK